MGDLFNIDLTAALTIVGGVVVYVSGELLSKSFIEPVYESHKTIGQIRFNRSYHAATIRTPNGESKEVSDKAREARTEQRVRLDR